MISIALAYNYHEHFGLHSVKMYDFNALFGLLDMTKMLHWSVFWNVDYVTTVSYNINISTPERI